MKLSASQFEELLPILSSWRLDRIEMARLHLVDEMTLPAIAVLYKCSKQSVYDAVRRALARKKKLDEAFKLRENNRNVK